MAAPDRGWPTSPSRSLTPTTARVSAEAHTSRPDVGCDSGSSGAARWRGTGSGRPCWYARRVDEGAFDARQRAGEARDGERPFDGSGTRSAAQTNSASLRLSWGRSASILARSAGGVQECSSTRM